MEQLNSLNWKAVLKIGLISGAVVLYAGVVGMIAAFHEREVFDDFITLGQLVLFLTPFLSAFYIAKRFREIEASFASMIVSGIIVGILTAIPTIVMLLFNSEEFRFLLDYTLRLLPFIVATYIAWRSYRSGADMSNVVGMWILIVFLTGIVTGSLALIFDTSGDLRSVLTNVNRDWIDVVTFDNRNELMTGIFVLAIASTIAGLLGSLFYALPGYTS